MDVQITMAEITIALDVPKSEVQQPPVSPLSPRSPRSPRASPPNEEPPAQPAEAQQQHEPDRKHPLEDIRPQEAVAPPPVVEYYSSPPISPFPPELFGFTSPPGTGATTLPPVLAALEPLMRASYDTLRYLRNNWSVLHSIELDNPNEYRSGSALHDLKASIKRLNSDLEQLYYLLEPVANILSPEAQNHIQLAFENVTTVIRNGMLTYLREAVEQRQTQSQAAKGKNVDGDHIWWAVTIMIPSPLAKKWDNLLNFLLGKRKKPEKSKGKGKRGKKIEETTSERIPSPFKQLDPKAQAALISVPDGSIQVLFAHVIDPKFTSSSHRLLWIFRRRRACSSALCKVDARLQHKVGYRCTCNHKNIAVDTSGISAPTASSSTA